MVNFMQFLGVLSILGGFLGISEYGFIDNGIVMEPNVYAIGVFAASGIIGFGVFWALAAIISNLQQINEKLSEEENHGVTKKNQIG
jgi:hypothetical protein